uniref:Autophagy-related protein 101 n=1 Tax=Leptobrachium leishanense TaxID=445787 RepID=A0A8C5M293_9ANUR
MNCRSEELEVSVEGRQVEEAMLAILHTILLHRSTGKFHYKKEGNYSIGTVGTQDVDCDFIEFTYVRVSSEELDRALHKAVCEFKDALRNSGNDGMGQLSLEFYQKKKSRWPFSDECIPWEVWTIKVNVVSLANEQERQICREKEPMQGTMSCSSNSMWPVEGDICLPNSHLNSYGVDLCVDLTGALDLVPVCSWASFR